MALKAVLASLAGLAPDIAKEYTQQGDKFVLNVEKTDGFELANTTGLLSALEKERGAAQRATAQLSAFGDITPEKAKEAMSKVVEFSKMDVDGKIAAGVKAREEQLIRQHDEAIKALNAKLTVYSNGLHDKLITADAQSAIIEEGGNPLLLLPHVTRFMRMQENGGRFFSEVVDASGNSRIGGTKDGVSVPMSTRQLVQELKANPSFAGAFSAGKSSGSGASGQGKSSGSGAPDLSKMSPEQKLAYARDNANNG